MKHTKYWFLLLLLLLSVGAAAQNDTFNPTNPPEPMAQYKVALSCTPSDAGYTSGAGKYTEGTNVNIRTSSRGSNYTFVHWLKDGEVYATEASFTYTVEARNVAFTAVYRFDPSNPPEPTTYNQWRIYLEQNMEGAGSFNRTSGAKAEAGTSVYLRAYNNQGFRFLGWYEGETLVNTNASFYYTMPNHHVTLTAKYRYDPDSPADPQSSQTDINNPVLGDVNADGKVNVGDFIATGSYILGRTINPFVFKAADINSDNQINVGDFIGIGSIILRGVSSGSSVPSPSPRGTTAVTPTDIDALDNALYIAPVTVAPGTQAVLSLRMKNKGPVAGFEFNLRLPEGVTVAVDGDGKPMAELSAERTTERKTNFFGSALQADGTLKVLCGTSAGDQDGLCSFSGNEGEVARITVNIPADYDEGDYLVTVANGVLSDVNAATIFLKPELAISNAYLSVHNSASGIDNAPFTLDNAPSGVYYTLDGMKLNGKPSKRGVYVVNGKKVVVK